MWRSTDLQLISNRRSTELRVVFLILLFVVVPRVVNACACRVYVSTCNRSNRVENTHDDLLYLENIATVQGRTRVSGVVDGDDENAAGQQVRITGKNKSYIATTDKNGVYELYDLPPGRYLTEPG